MDTKLQKKVSQWGVECLVSLGYVLQNTTPENITDTPWSYLLRYETNRGSIYLKYMPAMFALEPTIMQLLAKQYNINVPVVIGVNYRLHCFLMRDAGITIRALLQENFNEEFIFRVIEQFTSLQVAIEDNVDSLLDIGVPDYRLQQLPNLYNDVLKQKEWFITEGLSECEIRKLVDLSDTVRTLCNKLASYPVKQTIVQPDFNDNNVLFDELTNKVTIIDLGEVVISHPFFSLFNFLWQMEKHHKIAQGSDLYKRIKHACFKRFRAYFATNEDFQDAILVAEVVNNIYILVTYRIFMQVCGRESLLQFGYNKSRELLVNVIMAIK